MSGKERPSCSLEAPDNEVVESALGGPDSISTCQENEFYRKSQ